MALVEPDVALTDFALAAECALFAGWLQWRRGAWGPLRHWFSALFAALCVGALLGGITHGFFGSAQTDLARALWAATLVSIAVAALACWAIGAHLLAPGYAATRIVGAAAALWVVNVAAVLFVSPHFATAIAFYAPAVLFVLLGLVVAYVRTAKRALLPGIAGVLLSIVAAAVQQMQVAAFGLSHNAPYHVVQAVGLLLMFATALALFRPAVRP